MTTFYKEMESIIEGWMDKMKTRDKELFGDLEINENERKFNTIARLLKQTRYFLNYPEYS